MGVLSKYALYTTQAVTPAGASYSIPSGSVVACISMEAGEAYTPPQGMAVRAWANDALWTPPTAVPGSVEAWKCKMVMSETASKQNAGKTVLDDTNAIVPGLSTAQQIAWNNATVFDRQSPLLLSLASQIALASSDLDAMFIQAEGIAV